MDKVIRFTSDLDVKLENSPDKVTRRYKGVILDSIVWEIEYTGKPLPEKLSESHFVVIPKGFRCDGVTAPRILWFMIPPWGHPSTKASVLHDYLIERLKNGNPHIKFTTRKEIDKVFYEALLAVNFPLAKIFYYAVSLFTFIRYGN